MRSIHHRRAVIKEYLRCIEHYRMFRRLKLVIFVVIFATSVRHATAQDFGYRGRDLEKILGRGYTDEQLVSEKKLLAVDKSRTITWEDLPLIQFPRYVFLPDSTRANSETTNFANCNKAKSKRLKNVLSTRSSKTGLFLELFG
jgi:hypothetical protein